MTPQLRAFVETYKQKPKPKPTVRDFIKSHNHEIWRQCPKCGDWEDLRKTEHCENCGTKLN